jgi:predicted O-methyltransferase YrrM
MAFTTRIKQMINTALAPIGLEVSTTLARRIELSRLTALDDKQHWDNGRYTEGLMINEELCLEFLRSTCLPFKDEYSTFPQNRNGTKEDFYLQNGWFGPIDAEILYSLIRTVHPRHIIEVGSGFSTRLMRRAIRDGKLETKITSVDPMPNTSIAPFADEYIKVPIESIPLPQIVDTLDTNDILFIDSSHKVKTGGDVPYLFLEVLPRLKPGIFVHVHDVFFPFDYPKQWVMDGWEWNEQYLVHAFLCYNQRFEIRWPGSYVWSKSKEEIARVIPSTKLLSTPPASLWLETKSS